MKNGSVRDAALKDIAAIPSLSVETIVRAGGHEKIRVSTPSGIRMLVVSASASDWRAVLNNRSILRRWARGEA
jgi:hypothetical protein